VKDPKTIKTAFKKLLVSKNDHK